ncbi:hypothetical protein DRO69_10415 [Candidatus Bathyarchaeota archaeon]|nr:MAG: hypothetical protein DRO69_10415 [Candidatus Bathyarchaeota archaeon]
MWDILASGLIGVASGAITTYIVGKKLINSIDWAEKVQETIDNLQLTDAQVAKLYGIGQIVGRGIGDGLGLGKTRSKGKVFGLPVEVVMPFVQKLLNAVKPSENL